jgi:hypothetical protein
MKSTNLHADLTRRLAAMIRDAFPEMVVNVSHSPRWNRPCATFTSSAFEGLLPEERFHRLVGVIPADFREENMAGFVWLELAPGERLEEFLKLPRCEDVAACEKDIYGRLARAGLFESLAEAMGASPDSHCAGGFGEMTRLLTAAGLRPDDIRDAKLLMIRHHAYCDCQILLTARDRLAQRFADAA